jgi:hypothetical protein
VILPSRLVPRYAACLLEPRSVPLVLARDLEMLLRHKFHILTFWLQCMPSMHVARSYSRLLVRLQQSSDYVEPSASETESAVLYNAVSENFI